MAEHAHAEAAPETTAAPTPLVALRGASQVQMIQRLQQTAGNRAVAAMIARKVTYDECSTSQQSQIGDAHTRGKEMAKIAIKKLRDYDGSSPAEVKTALKKHFNCESKWVAKIVANNLDHVVPQVDDTQYECHEEQKGSSEAEALWCIPWSDIKVFPLWYAQPRGRQQDHGRARVDADPRVDAPLRVQARRGLRVGGGLRGRVDDPPARQLRPVRDAVLRRPPAVT